MHNTDRTQLESYPYAGEGYLPQQEYGYHGETMDEEIVNPYTGEINQDLEMQLAAELLGVNSEEELNYFLGGLVKRIGGGLRRFASSGAGRAIFSTLKSAAKVALPKLAGMAATFIPGVGPIAGPLIGKAVGSAVGGLEIEGMSNEDSQFEIARRIVRMGVDSARQIETLPEGEIMDEEIWSAIAGAARRYLPNVARSVVSGARSIAGSIAAGASGGLGGNISVQSPSGWSINAGGQAQGGLAGSASGSTTAGGAVNQGRPGARRGTWRRVAGGILVIGA